MSTYASILTGSRKNQPLALVPVPVGATLPRTETEQEVGFLNTWQSHGKLESLHTMGPPSGQPTVWSNRGLTDCFSRSAQPPKHRRAARPGGRAEKGRAAGP